jgi:nucleoside 2-deoxyribosyltransferase
MVVHDLRYSGFEVYDFKNPSEGNKGFHSWSEIDINWKDWTPDEYRKFLNHPIAIRSYESDFSAMKWADVFVGVQPFGRSTSMEMGWAAGNGKKTILLLENGEPELMVKMFDYICCYIKEVLDILNTIKENYE